MKKTALSVLFFAACGTFSPAPAETRSEGQSSEAPPPVDPNRPPEPREPRDPPRPGFTVTSIGLAANEQADAVAYTLECSDCIVPAADGGSVVTPGIGTVSLRLYNPRAGSGVNPLYESKAARMGQTNVIALTISGENFLGLTTDDTGSLRTLQGGALPGGAVISAAVSGLRQTPSSSFGTMVRSGQAVGNPDGSAQFLVAAEAGGLATLQVKADTQATLTTIGPPEADIGVIAQAGDHLALAYHTRNEGTRDSEVTVLLGGGAAPVVTPILGVPAALWSNGSDFKVVLKKSDSIAALWDGTTLIDLPRSDEAACTAVAFSPTGELVFLSAGPQSAVLWAVTNGVLTGPKVLSVREAAGPKTSACAAAFGKTLLHVAWAEDSASIQHQMIDMKTGKVELRTKHDTAKNSVSNIR